MTTLADFSAYYLRSIWRTGDAELEQDLPRLIREAEARISRDLRDTRLIVEAAFLSVYPSSTVPLPPDFKELVTLELEGGRLARAVSTDTIDIIRARDNASYRFNERSPYVYYSILGNSILFNRTDNADLLGRMRYYAGITPMTNEEHNFYDLHPDFFKAALNVQVYNYLREFELSQEHNGNYGAILEEMRRQSNYTMFPSGQLVSPLSADVR